ncbi:indolepyruvate decarboxylase [Blattamonas nauphoetae]|uniref:Indolepyruvate decarboxylase n=1 Tax=Blattamonas nauphoetae TaxID=2049346 RepID=A0ABQ9X1Z8_9EUKA|nr:indolepyruvate decarboxylase [Blattamonas nauphoetae]
MNVRTIPALRFCIKMSSPMNLSQFLLQRLHSLGTKTIFGVPGDFVMHFMDKIQEYPDMSLLPTSNELTAAYMADAYAKASDGGVGCLCVTYGVGSLSALNGIALSYAENVPVILISGLPSSVEWQDAYEGKTFVHHTTGTSSSLSYEAECFRPVTCGIATLGQDPVQNCIDIDAALYDCVTLRRPILIQIPLDVVDLPLLEPTIHPSILATRNFRHEAYLAHDMGDMVSAQATVAIVEELIVKAKADNKKYPLALHLGVELQHYYQTNDAVRTKLDGLIHLHRLPFTCDLLGRSVFDDTHPLFLGPFNGNDGRDNGIHAVMSDAGCVLCLGSRFYDASMKEATADKRYVWIRDRHATNGETVIQNVTVCSVIDILEESLAKHLPRYTTPCEGLKEGLPRTCDCDLRDENKLHAKWSFNEIVKHIPPCATVVSDIGDVAFRFNQHRLPAFSKLVHNNFYKSIGYALPASVGAYFALKDSRLFRESSNAQTQPEEPFVVCVAGDGAIHMTIQAFSEMLNHKCNILVCVWNNREYGIEKVLHPNGDVYNDLFEWDYSSAPHFFCHNRERQGPHHHIYSSTHNSVNTPSELTAFLTSLSTSSHHGPAILDIRLPKLDMSSPLKVWGTGLDDKMASHIEKIVTITIEKNEATKKHPERELVNDERAEYAPGTGITHL